jgi:hypothetical protein
MKQIANTNLKKYNTGDKKFIATRIEKVPNKKILAKIFQIVHTNNGRFVESPAGITLNLTSMRDETLAQIERLLDLYDAAISTKNSKMNNDNTIKWSDRLQNHINSETNDIDGEKLSNQEKMFLKRQQNVEEVVFWNGNPS